MHISEVKFDCRHFRGDVPCVPNKQRGKICDTCDEYAPVKTRILIIKLGAVGDVIRTTPLLQRFRQEYPAAHITWLTHTPEVVPKSRVDRIYKFDLKSVFALSHLQFDVAINLDKDLEACALINDIAAKQKLGFGLVDGHVGPINPMAEHKFITGMFDSISQQNTKNYLEEIFEICGFDFRKEPYVLEVNHAHHAKWDNLRKQAEGRKIIGLNTGCGERWLTRLWPEEYWVDLIRQLLRNGFYPMLLGGPYEEERNRSLARQSEAFYPGTFSLQEFISLSSQCSAIVTAVTMMMHIAIGLRVPLVLFNNIFNPHEFELYGNGVMIQPETGCDCYFAQTCRRERHCMLDVSVATVLRAVESMAGKSE